MSVLSSDFDGPVSLIDTAQYRKLVMHAAGVLGRYFSVPLYVSKGELERTHVIFMNLLANALPGERTRTYVIDMLVEALSNTKVQVLHAAKSDPNNGLYAYREQVLKTPAHVIAVAFGLSVFRSELQIPYELCHLEMSAILTLVRRLQHNPSRLLFDKVNDDILHDCKRWV
ncbi:hypothetical protein [Rhizobium metallidurans]|uniref:Uncharacterized protein n=1 Tax=Rhizobium metallidurans TaxID=1265931 RepID=A0A7W6GDQ9_9HYPH|nr:hypothetical protein [Rhizobium metallidurans]MBB3967164.1 hypothetical protein [Rhizobium metallidurans]